MEVPALKGHGTKKLLENIDGLAWARACARCTAPPSLMFIRGISRGEHQQRIIEVLL